VYTVSALIAGTGVGLFIDEVGKFITQNNDYFYPLAAPIIYTFFLLIVMLYLRVRRPPVRGARAELYRALDAMEEILEHDLDPVERADLEQCLNDIIANSSQWEYTRLAQDLLDFLNSEEVKIVPARDTFWSRVYTRWRSIEERYASQRALRAALAGGLLGLGLVSLANITQAMPVGAQFTSLERMLTRLIETGLVNSPRGLSWFAARLALETSVGLLLLVSAGLYVANKDALATAMAYLGLLLSLTTVNLLVFYFDQFSTIITATVQLILLLGITYYRRRFILQPVPIPEPPQVVENSAQETENRSR
jgi:hypothetical protein